MEAIDGLWALLLLVLAGLSAIAFVSLLYHYALAIAGWRRHVAFPPSQERLCFAILIPAHNEQAVISETLAALQRLAYPPELVRTYVVADHCTDDTAALARAQGAICLERSQGPRGRKAFPLQSMIALLLDGMEQFDALVIIDADSRLDTAFLQQMRDALAAGHAVLQGQHRISAPCQSSYARLADADMRLNNLMRNHAKRNLGLSARLMGDAMCFRRSILERYGWPTDSFGEDREFGMFLVSRGVRVVYVPEALSFGQGAPRWRDASSQRLRWQAGERQMRRNRAKELAVRARDANDWAAADLLAELILPSYTVAALFAGIAAVGYLLLGPMAHPLLAAFGYLVLFLAFCFPIFGLVAARAPLASFNALLWGPVFVLWRVMLRVKGMLMPARARWVRTKRREEMGR